MVKKNRSKLLALIIALFVLGSCRTTVPEVQPNPENPQTLAAQTWSVMQTMAALTGTPTAALAPATNAVQPTEAPAFTNTPTPTQTLVPMLTAFPTSSPLPTWTATLVPTATRWVYYPGGGGVIPPPPRPGNTQVNAKPCYAAEFVRDITIPDGTNLPRNTEFTKVWRIENTGTCTWESKLYFAPVGFVGGSPKKDPFDGKPIQIGEKVKPGKTIDIAVSLITPDRDGSIKSQWVFTDKNEVFGNKGTNKAFSLSVNVFQTVPNPVFDFSNNLCKASWNSNAHKVKNQIKISDNFVPIQCNGKPNNPLGFVRKMSEPGTEAGPATGLMGVWENPPFVKDGITQGMFPALLILPGDRFSAYVGCLFESDECDVTFELKYRVITFPYAVVEEKTISRDQVYDGAIGSLEIDLGSLGLYGNYVEFFFRVKAKNDSKQNTAIWISPGIVH